MGNYILGFLIVTVIFGLFGLPAIGGGMVPLARMTFLILAFIWVVSMIAGFAEAERLTHHHHHA